MINMKMNSEALIREEAATEIGKMKSSITVIRTMNIATETQHLVETMIEKKLLIIEFIIGPDITVQIVIEEIMKTLTGTIKSLGRLKMIVISVKEMMPAMRTKGNQDMIEELLEGPSMKGKTTAMMRETIIRVKAIQGKKVIVKNILKTRTSEVWEEVNQTMKEVREIMKEI
jgi:hypothetical protein